MRILIIGAGVTGSIYASYLINAKKKLEKKLNDSIDIQILARGESYTRIKNNGLKINHYIQDIITIDQIPAIKTLESKDVYDYVLIFLRKTQIADLLPDLSNNKSKNFVFIGNNGSGADEYEKYLPINKILLGFPSVGGKKEGNIVHSVHKDKPGITIGAVSPLQKQNVKTLRRILKTGKIKVSISNNMDSWLKYHIALVSPVANAIFYDGGDNFTLSNNNEVLNIMIKAIREGYKSLRSLNFPVKPTKLILLMLLPDFIIKGKLKKLLSSEIGKLVIYDHCQAAPEEMKDMAKVFQIIIKDSPVIIENIQKLSEQFI